MCRRRGSMIIELFPGCRYYVASRCLHINPVQACIEAGVTLPCTERDRRVAVMSAYETFSYTCREHVVKTIEIDVTAREGGAADAEKRAS